MHDIQRKLIALSQSHDLGRMGLREIGRMIGEPHPQKIKYHLQKLNLLKEDESKRTFQGDGRGQMISIPIFGLANCGPATIFAEQIDDTKYLQISSRLIKCSSDSLFAVQAVGNSMNRANINGKSIHEGDYVIIDADDRDLKTGDYVLSTINNLANIKRLVRDSENRQVMLLSESTDSYPHIFIHEGDFDHYFANGKVVDVLKVSHEFEDVVYDKLLSQF